MPGKPRWWKLVAVAPDKQPDGGRRKVRGQMAAAGSDPVLELDRLSVAYDRAPVVRDLTLTVGHGPRSPSRYLGANGAGTTTTLRAISGLLEAAQRRGPAGRN